jgi:DNA-directed RNA polymerase specialized sigma24 family protein
LFNNLSKKVKQKNIYYCLFFIMTTANFYQHFDQITPRIQRLASILAQDFETARFLYQETAHQAIKNKDNLDQETLEEWLMEMVKSTYYKIVQQRILFPKRSTRKVPMHR